MGGGVTFPWGSRKFFQVIALPFLANTSTPMEKCPPTHTRVCVCVCVCVCVAYDCQIYKLRREVAMCMEGERSQSVAQARIDSAQMAGEGVVDQIRETTSHASSLGSLAFRAQAPGVTLKLLPSCRLSGREGWLIPSVYGDLFVPLLGGGADRPCSLKI